MNSKDRRSESLCEKSMKIVTNIIKLSSFSLARASLGPPRSSLPNRSLTPQMDLTLLANGSLIPQFPGSKQSQKSRSSLKPITYLVDPGSSYLIHEEQNVDRRASDYIEKVHKKNTHQYYETIEDSPPIILPPPPRMVK